MTKQSTDRSGNIIKPCECGCRTLGLRCVRIEDSDPTPATEPRPAVARYLP